jgi:hypothetical protein
MKIGSSKSKYSFLRTDSWYKLIDVKWNVEAYRKADYEGYNVDPLKRKEIKEKARNK